MTLPEGSKDIILYCDVWRVGFSGVLQQNGKVVAYAFTKLKGTWEKLSNSLSRISGSRIFLKNMGTLHGHCSCVYVYRP